MLIDDEVALREWLVATLEPLCDTEPLALARYVLALVAKDKPLDKLRENCIDRLEVFLDRTTKDFVDQLFDVIRNGRYIPEAKKENVQPKASESSDDKSAESADVTEAQTCASPSRDDQEQQQIPSSSTATLSTDQSTTVHEQSAGAITQPVKRRNSYRSSSGRHHSPNPRRHINASSGGAHRHQATSHYRPSTTSTSNHQRSHRSSSRSRSISPPPAKRSQRSYSHSSTGSSSRSSPSRQTSTINQPLTTASSNTNFLYKRTPCNDFLENKGFCARGDSCPYDHGTNALVFDQQQQQQQQHHPQHQQLQQRQQHPFYPQYPPYGMPPGQLHPRYHEYNPETPDMKHGLRQGPPMFMRHPMHPHHHHHPRMHGPPLPPIQSGQQQQQQLSQQQQQQQMMMMNPQRTLVTVVTNAEPLPLEQRIRPMEPMGMSSGPPPPMGHVKRHGPMGPYPNERRQQQHEQPPNNDPNNNSKNQNNGYNNRGWKRPWQKPDGSGSAPATLEIRKIPVEFNTISKLNEHFSKYGTVTNVQIAYDGSPDSALVAYGTAHEAETAYKNPQPLFNNRFIKIFWHNSNKAQNPTGPNNTSGGVQPAQQPPVSMPTSTSSSEVSSTKKSSSNPHNPMKLHWLKTQELAASKTEQKPTTSEPTSTSVTTAAPVPKKPMATTPTVAKKDAAKKAAMEIQRKKQVLLDGQIQQQKLLLKKFESAESNAEKDSIRALMKQVDATIVMLKDSLRSASTAKSAGPPTAAALSRPAPVPKLSQQDALKQRAQTLQKEIDKLRAKTSADMRRGMRTNLVQASAHIPNVLHENNSRNTSIGDDADEQRAKQLLIKNIEGLPRQELDAFLTASGAKTIQSGQLDHSLLVTFNALGDVEKIQEHGLKFHERQLETSLLGDSSLNRSGKKRTLSETMEDELLGGDGGAATGTNREDEDDADDTSPRKKHNRSQPSDSDENEEVDECVDEEDQLLTNNEKSTDGNGTKDADVSLLDPSESNEDEDDDDEVQFLDS